VTALVLVANTINIGADLGAMGAAAHLIIPVNFTLLTLFFTALILCLEIYTSYRTYAKILKWFALALLSYPLTVFLVHEPWGTLFRATFVPHVQLSFAFLFIITGVLGTTISPYMFSGSVGGNGRGKRKTFDTKRRGARHEKIYPRNAHR